MRKSNNKGFSLIEVVISVAVLTLLIVPIITQLVKARETNANAKERQAAVENADKLLEYFQKTEKLSLDKGGTGEIKLHKPADADFQSHEVTCKLVSPSGATLGTVTYNATDYEADDVVLGRNKTSYGQTIILDDLNNKVMAEGYRISTSATAPDDGWVTTNEGNVVKYDSTNHVVEAIVQERDASEGAYLDPNEANLGYVQNLEGNKIAIIAGDETSLDEQFNTDVYNTVLSAAIASKSKISDENWNEMTEKYVVRSGGVVIYDGTLLDYNIKRVSTTTARVLYINVTYDEFAADPHYHVEMDAFYSTTIDPLKINGITLTSTLQDVYHYPVYEKDFYTTTPPDVYLVYEPLHRVYSGMESYVTDDYIVTACDESILEDQDTKSNLYLIKSKVTSLDGTVSIDGNKFLSEFNGNKPTRIHVSSLAQSDDHAAMDIYTNISTTPVDEDDPSSIYELKESDSENQFKVGPMIPSEIELQADFKNIKSKYSTVVAYERDQIKALTEGKRTEARLFTVRVTLQNKDTNDKIYLTGAKGAD